MWFRDTFGFDETDRATVLSQIVEDGPYLVSRPTARRMHTHGPACAIACGAGTLHRNYFVEMGGSKGQIADRQMNAISGLAAALGMRVEVQNGYVWPTEAQLVQASDVITAADEDERDRLAGTLAIGVHADTEVTWMNAGHSLTQAFCSALPIAYLHDLQDAPWEPLARLVLDAAYEATLAAAAITPARTGNRAGTYGLELRLVTYG
ncbi:MAG TPA: hypothetical protein VIL68_13165 [Propionibacteriaceae bacterium]